MNYDLTVLETNPEYLPGLADLYFGSDLVSAQRIGEGFYGVIYLLNLKNEPGRVILKCYKHSGRNLQEYRQLNLLGKHSLIKVPQAYHIHNYTGDMPFDALMMEYIEGINASMLPTEHPNREAFADEMIENLVHLHGVTNNSGFGSGDEMFTDWKTCLKSRISAMHGKLHSDFNGIVSQNVFGLIDKSVEAFDQIFAGPVEKSSLVHSDYNLWNILVDERTARITAVIDPLDAGWADREIDLFHLQNADGDRFGLLDRYKKIAGVSDLFEVKNSFYWFWDDVKHLINVGWYDEERFSSFGNRLLGLMNEYNIK